MRIIENALASAAITAIAAVIWLPIWILGLTDETDEYEEID
jgi:hypothetical protein